MRIFKTEGSQIFPNQSDVRITEILTIILYHKFQVCITLHVEEGTIPQFQGCFMW